MTKNKRAAAERARQAMAAQRKAEQQRMLRMRIAAGAVAAVVVVVAVLIIVKLSSGGENQPTVSASGPAPASVVDAVTGVPADVLDTVGAGKASSNLPKALANEPVASADGKPLVLYVGAEYCPFCAAQRWPVVVALSRFGTFSNLQLTHSSSEDSFPNTISLSFHGASYTSQYLTFQGLELYGNERKGNSYPKLDTPNDEQKQLIAKYNAPPYVDKNSAGSIPWMDFGNQALLSGSMYSPDLLKNRTADEIAKALSDPNSDIAKSVDGAANALTTMLCKLTNGQPATVCQSAAAKAYEGKFNA